MNLTLSIHRGSSVSTIVCSQTVIQERVFSLGNSSSSAEPRLTAFSKARRAAWWTSIASNIGSARSALAALATAADAASAAAVERKPRRVVLVELVIWIFSLCQRLRGSMIGAGRVLTHPPGSFFNPASDGRAVNSGHGSAVRRGCLRVQTKYWDKLSQNARPTCPMTRSVPWDNVRQWPMMLRILQNPSGGTLSVPVCAKLRAIAKTRTWPNFWGLHRNDTGSMSAAEQAERR